MPILGSKLSDVYIPDQVSFPGLILNRAQLHGDKVAFIDAISGKKVLYRQLEGIVRTLAGALYHQHGLRKGDVLCICMNNCFEYPLAVYAVLSLGGIVTTCNPLNVIADIRSQVVNSGTTYMLTMPEMSSKIRDATKNLKIKKTFVVGREAGLTSFDSLLTYKGPRAPDVKIDPKNDIALLPYSSGTTGKQKGVMLTHYNMVANCCQAGHPEIEMGSSKDVFAWPLPFYHLYGISTVFGFIPCEGGTTAILPKFNLELYLKSIQQYKVTFLFIVPPIALHLARSPLVDKYDVSSVRILWCGAAPLAKDLQSELIARMKNVPVKGGYGLTETSPMILFPPVRDWKVGAAGVLCSNTVCKVRDVENNESLGPNKEGELCIKGPQVMKGYLGNPAATKETIDEEGWIHTGDLVYYDDDQHFYVVDRLKELIKYKGFQVAPADLEALLLTHPSVLDVAVIGRPDLEAGELPMAFVVTKPGKSATEAELVSFVAERVSPHKRLRGGVEFISEIPKSAAGKILRKNLREKLKRQQSAKL